MIAETHGLDYKIYYDITKEHVANIYYDKNTDSYRAELLIKEILQANGIYEYDWSVLIRINHSRVTDDDYSVEAVE